MDDNTSYHISVKEQEQLEDIKGVERGGKWKNRQQNLKKNRRKGNDP
jgi:hypothetical protein